jgi:predicted SAM-dependent methyltransferase
MKKSKKQLIDLIGISEESFEILRFELNMFLLRCRNRFDLMRIFRIKRLINGKNLLVNIGCGPFGEDKPWINIDMFYMKNVSFVYDTRRRLPFKDNSIECMRLEHVLEHMHRNDEAIILLKETKRCLMDNGVVRIIVPDIEKFIRAYTENNFEKILEINSKMLPRVHYLNHVFRQGGEHKFGYDFEALSVLLKEAGFEKIYLKTFGESINEKLENDQANHKLYSLYVEAQK